MLTQQNATRFTKAYTSLFPHLFVSNKYPLIIISIARTRIVGFSSFSCHTIIFTNKTLTNRHFKNGSNYGNRMTTNRKSIYPSTIINYTKNQ